MSLLEECPYCGACLEEWDIEGTDETLEECPSCERAIYVEAEYDRSYYIKKCPTEEQIKKIANFLPKSFNAKAQGVELKILVPETFAGGFRREAHIRWFEFPDCHIPYALVLAIGNELAAHVKVILQEQS